MPRGVDVAERLAHEQVGAAHKALQDLLHQQLVSKDVTDAQVRKAEAELSNAKLAASVDWSARRRATNRLVRERGLARAEFVRDHGQQLLDRHYIEGSQLRREPDARSDEQRRGCAFRR